MIVDVHVHFTQAPPQLDGYRGKQMSALNKPVPARLGISDDQLREALRGNIRQMRERRIDRLMFSPRAAGMNHDVGGELVSRYWAEANNDLIARVCRLYPEHFSPVGQLPQSPGVSPAGCVEEIDRCVLEHGFVGFNVNPDVSGGLAPLTPSLGDEWWYPLWGRLVELDVPACVHASSTQHPGQHLNGSHYINWDTAAVVELCNSRVFADFPKLKLIIPHAGGSTPFQFNRQRSLNTLRGTMPFEEVVSHLYFDLAVYDEDSFEMTIRKISPDRLMYASEMFGTAKAIDPNTGRAFDDTVPMVERIDWLSAEGKAKILGGTAMRVFNRAKWPALV